LLSSKGLSLDAVIELSVDEDALVSRIVNRAGESSDARADDNVEILRNRLVVYKEQTAPIIPYYREKGALKTVDGMGSVEVVASAIASILDAA
ncbi:MAG: nucleoside monophosphate kinase, partial [Rhodospirillales bacterium]